MCRNVQHVGKASVLRLLGDTHVPYASRPHTSPVLHSIPLDLPWPRLPLFTTHHSNWQLNHDQFN